MGRKIFAFFAGFVTWAVVATLINFGLRAGIPGYHLAEPTMNFTLGMKMARLILGALSSLAAGAVTALIAPFSRWLPWVLGIVILALFVPSHIYLWAKFPIWYHLSFLGTLVPLVAIGGSMARGSRTSTDESARTATNPISS